MDLWPRTATRTALIMATYCTSVSSRLQPPKKTNTTNTTNTKVVVWGWFCARLRSRLRLFKLPPSLYLICGSAASMFLGCALPDSHREHRDGGDQLPVHCILYASMEKSGARTDAVYSEHWCENAIPDTWYVCWPNTRACRLPTMQQEPSSGETVCINRAVWSHGLDVSCWKFDKKRLALRAFAPFFALYR